MGRLTDTKVRGFMVTEKKSFVVTETNNDACAQLQLVLHALLALPTSQLTDPASPSVEPFIPSRSISIDSDKANSGR